MSTIYHNPRCSTSRKALEALRAANHDVQIIEYLHDLPKLDALRELIDSAGIGVRQAMRTNEAIYQELDLGRAELSDADLLQAIEAHPVLLQRPFVVTERGTRLCRPFELIEEII